MKFGGSCVKKAVGFKQGDHNMPDLKGPMKASLEILPISLSLSALACLLSFHTHFHFEEGSCLLTCEIRHFGASSSISIYVVGKRKCLSKNLLDNHFDEG